MRKLMLLLVVAMLFGIVGSAMATSQTAPVNLVVDKYAFGYFPVTNEAVDYSTYGAIPANNTSSFDIELKDGAVTGSDTVNMVWGANCMAQISIGFNQNSLPGSWSMEFDGAGVTGPTQAFNTEAKDIGKLLAVPIKLTVTVPYLYAAGTYAGTLNIISVTPL